MRRTKLTNSRAVLEKDQTQQRNDYIRPWYSYPSCSRAEARGPDKGNLVEFAPGEAGSVSLHMVWPPSRPVYEIKVFGEWVHHAEEVGMRNLM